VLSFRVIVTTNQQPPAQETVSNDVTVKGFNKVEISDGDDQTNNIAIGDGDGWMMGENARLDIHKVDSDLNPLAGAQFQLFDPLDRPVGTPVTAGPDGVVSYNHLVYSTSSANPYIFTLVETKPPPGYSIMTNPDFANGVPVPLEDQVTVLEVENLPIEVSLLKANENDDPLAGAQFMLDMQQNGQWVKIGGPYTSDANGIVHVQSQQPDFVLTDGHYRFVETKAPEGYALDENKNTVEFDIAPTAAGSGIYLPIDAGTYVNYPLEINLSKNNQDGAPLAGAEFRLEKQEGDEWVTLGDPDNPYVTDANGKINIQPQPDQLFMYGRYRFIETKAPHGYLLVHTPLPFDIDPATPGSAMTGPIEVGPFVNVPITATLAKENQNGAALAGAEFMLEKLEGHHWTAVGGPYISDAHGNVQARTQQDLTLTAGRYRFKEIKAPFGYVLNDKPLEFEIKAGVTGPILAGRFINNPVIDLLSLNPNPRTGDETPILPWVIALIAAAAGVTAGVIIWRKKRKRTRH